MKETSAVPVIQLAAIAAGMLAAAAASRGISRAVRLTLEELDYRAGDLESWLRRLS